MDRPHGGGAHGADRARGDRRRRGVAAFLTVTVIPGSRLGPAATLRASERTLRLVIAGLLGALSLAYAVGETVSLLT